MDISTMPTLAYEERIDAFLDYLAARRAVEVAGPSSQPNAWEVFGYDEAVRVLHDHEHFSNDFTDFIPADEEQLAQVARGNLVGADPPRHRRLRSLVNQAFTPQMTARLAPRVQARVDLLLDRAAASADRGDTVSMDLVRQFASPLSSAVIAELFGVPDVDQDQVWEWSNALLGSRPDGDLGLPDDAAMAKRAALIRDAADYLVGHIRAKRETPGDDLTSRLIAAELDGERLTDEEIFGLIGMFLIAGHLPSAVLTANTVMCLEEHPDALTQVRQHPAALPGAIDEVLRWRPPLTRDQRLSRDGAELAGQAVPDKSMVVIWLASINRDERHFPEPDRFDITRSPNRHRTFGLGIHYCIGAPLAKLEAEAAVTALLHRCPDLAVDRGGDIEFHPSIGVLGPVRLPVTFRFH